MVDRADNHPPGPTPLSGVQSLGVQPHLLRRYAWTLLAPTPVPPSKRRYLEFYRESSQLGAEVSGCPSVWCGSPESTLNAIELLASKETATVRGDGFGTSLAVLLGREVSPSALSFGSVRPCQFLHESSTKHFRRPDGGMVNGSIGAWSHQGGMGCFTALIGRR